MSIEVRNETTADIDELAFVELAAWVLQQMHVSPSAEVALSFIDEDAIEALHVEWLDLPGPTDVMSFPMDELMPGTPDRPTPPGMLGDIVICPSVAAAQARQAGHSPYDEMLLLFVHGMLHLLGYDHATQEEEAEMFALQRQLLLTYLAKK